MATSSQSLPELLTQPKYALLSKSKLKKALKKDGHQFNARDVDKYHGEGEVNQRFARVQFDRSSAFKITTPMGWFQVDVVFFPRYPEENDGITRFLLFENVLSRKAYAYPIRSGSVADLLKVYKQFLKDAKSVKGLIGDEQFGAKGFVDFNASRGIDVYHDIAANDHITGGDKLGLVDSLCKTVKRLMLKYIAHTDELRWTEWLPTVISAYNSSPHSSLGDMSPNEVDGDKAYQLGEHIIDTAHNTHQLSLSSIQPDMKVRIVEARGTFSKDGPRFSKEIYTTDSLDGFRWKVRNEEGRLQRRRFKAQELLPVGQVRKAVDAAVQRAAEAKTSHATKLRRSGLFSTDADVRKNIVQPPAKSTRIRRVPRKLRE